MTLEQKIQFLQGAEIGKPYTMTIDDDTIDTFKNQVQNGMDERIKYMKIKKNTYVFVKHNTRKWDSNSAKAREIFDNLRPFEVVMDEEIPLHIFRNQASKFNREHGRNIHISTNGYFSVITESFMDVNLDKMPKEYIEMGVSILQKSVNDICQKYKIDSESLNVDHSYLEGVGFFGSSMSFISDEDGFDHSPENDFIDEMEEMNTSEDIDLNDEII